MHVPTAQFSSYEADKRYDFNITSSLLASTPIWDKDETNPPLSARSAMAIARTSLRTLFADGDQWRLTEVALHPVHSDRWVYLVTFMEPPRNGCMDCLSPLFSVVVLMDGTAVQATVSDWKPNTGTELWFTDPL